MFLFLSYFILACLIANYFGRKRIIHYWWAFFFSFFFGLIIGISICLTSKEKSLEDHIYNNEKNYSSRIITIILLALINILGLYYNYYLLEKDNSFLSVVFNFGYLPFGLFVGIIGIILYELRAITYSKVTSVSINREIDGLIVIVLTALFFIIENPQIDFTPTSPSSIFRV